MTLAGVDFGTTLVKAVWRLQAHQDAYRFLSTADVSLEEIAEMMKADGVTELYVAGIGVKNSASKMLSGFETKTNQGDPVKKEIEMQIDGAKRLLVSQGYCPPLFLLVTIGTGTSYTLVTEGEHKHFPIGNSISGGFIMGIGRLLGASDYDRIDRSALQGSPLDLLIKDMLPEKKGTLEGEFVIANFGKDTVAPQMPDVYASVLSTVAVATIRDVLIMGMIPGFGSPKEIVFVGSAVSRSQRLRQILGDYALRFERIPLFPKHGEFALALGAYHAAPAQIHL